VDSVQIRIKDEAVQFLSDMLEPDRLSGDGDRFELGFVERESTPEPAMKLAIRLHVAVV
jgi:hypothetical protein